MCDQEDEVQRLIQRTRANREKLNRHLNDFGESPHPIRSPLREKNVTSFSSSPSKLIRTSTFTKSSATPGSGSSSGSSSPTRIRTNALLQSPSSKTKKYGGVVADEIPDNSSKETFNREVTERKTTIEGSPVRDGNVETYTKTTITEMEEKIHKTEHIKFTEVVGGSRGSIVDTPNVRDRIKAIASRFSSNDGDDRNVEEETTSTTTVTTKRNLSPVGGAGSSSSPRRSPSPKRSPPAKKAFAPSPPKAKSPPKTKTSSYSSPIVTSSHRTYDTYDEEVFGASGRKKRLAALASKFHNYEEEDEEEDEELAAIDDSLNITKEVDVDEEIASFNDAEQQQAKTPKTPMLNKDAQFLKSLRAQGFEETTASKTRLVYDFNKTPQQQHDRTTILSSPTKTATEPRPPSPHKPHPMQFISPQVNMAISRGISPARGRPLSPTKPDASSNHRPVSPYKPHPMQFISPQKTNNSMRPPPASEPRPPPSKPARSWAIGDEDVPAAPAKTWRTEATAQVTPTIPTAPKPPPMSAPMTDTASRRSMAEKWSLFEKQAPTQVSPQVDPAMMSLSDRRALFEKHRSAPKPVARFGDAVTPAMLFRGQGRIEAPGQPKQLFAPPPQRPRSASPPRKRMSPPKRPTTPEYQRSPMQVMPQQQQQQRPQSPVRPPSPTTKDSPQRMVLRDTWKQNLPESPRENKRDQPEDEKSYPGVNSLKRIKVSPPKPGQLYPQLLESSDEERPGTSMSMESAAPSEAPSLGTAIRRAAGGGGSSSPGKQSDAPAPSFGAAIKRAASAYKLMQDRRNAMPPISERSPTDHDEDAEMTADTGEIDDMLDEALDDSYASSSANYRSEGPTPPKNARIVAAQSPTSSAASWEFQTPSGTGNKRQQKDYKTPLVEQMVMSPQGELPEVEGEEGAKLMHTVSFYRRQQVNVTPHQKIVRNAAAMIVEEPEKTPRETLQLEIRKLQDESEEQRQRMEQASKALHFCVSQDEFEGSAERVEGERLLLEATHKYTANMAEIRRLSTEGAIGKAAGADKGSGSKGSISISGLGLPLKADFIRMLRAGGDDTVHYFVVLIKYRSRVVATQMLSTIDGINRGKLVFPNLINLRDLDFDFQIHLEVYGLQTRKEHIPHDVKYHIRKEKSVFNLTPLKKLKKQESSPFPRNQNPVNSKTIRRPAFGMVGYAVINIQTLKNRAFQLDKVPEMSPLEGGLEMTLTIHSESRIEQRGFLTLFTDVNGYGDWCRRWCRLSGNALHFWKYPEDESKVEPSEHISLSICVTGDVALAPREVCSRMNTFMLETKRPWRQGDQDSLVMHVNRKSGLTTIRHLLSADTRDERIGWCSILNRALENNRAWDPNAFRPRSESMGSQSSLDSGSTAGASSTSTDIW